MAFTTGTATDYHDLLLKLKNWLSGSAGWTIDLWTPPPSGILSQAVLIAHPAGGGTNRRPYCMFRTFGNSAAPYYTIECRVASNYESAKSFINQLEVSPAVYLSSSNASMKYWFYANSRRVIIVTKIGTSYVSAYLGMYLAYALPSEQERPFYVGANTSDVTMQATSNSYLNNFIADPGQNCAYVLNKGLSWRNVNNRVASAASDLAAYGGSLSECCIWPKKNAPTAMGSTTGMGSFVGNAFAAMRPNANGEMPLIQCHIVDPLENANYGSVLGALDGVFAVGGFNKVAEQLLTVGSQEFRVFQNGIRSSLNHFMAIEEI